MQHAKNRIFIFTILLHVALQIVAESPVREAEPPPNYYLLTTRNCCVSSYNYNTFGDLTSTTNAKGVTATFTYDGVGRILTKNIPEGNIEYTYDSFSGSENSVGRLVRIEDSSQNKT
ncbi:RHS repeat domain-containing protein, partial [Leptospira interrogans]|uniref:RHS repeat domain-containing protein n=2 Tax=Leptospira interrogans TaxID=173 RepID=UPI0022B78354